MQLAKVIGTVVATEKYPALHGIKLLMVQPLDEQLTPAGAPLVAVDSVQAGPDDIVYLTMAREASLALPDPFAPVDAAITGIVDQVHEDAHAGIANKEGIFDHDPRKSER